MLWIFILALVLTGASLKLGMVTTMVSVLSVALVAAAGSIVLLVAFILWRSLRR